MTDPDLIDEVAGVDPDRGKGIIDGHVADNASSGKAQTRHDKQRKKRRASRFFTDDGCDAITLAGDRETIDELCAKIDRGANNLFRKDGGRGASPGDHPRTRNQRFFDAAIALLGDNPTTPTTSDAANSGRPDHGDCDPRNPAEPPRASKRYTPKNTANRPVIVVTATLDKLSGLNHDQAAHIIGSGPIADSVPNKPSTNPAPPAHGHSDQPYPTNSPHHDPHNPPTDKHPCSHDTHTPARLNSWPREHSRMTPFTPVISVSPRDVSGSELFALLSAEYAYMDGRIVPPSSLLTMTAADIENKMQTETLLVVRTAEDLAGASSVGRKSRGST